MSKIYAQELISNLEESYKREEQNSKDLALAIFCAEIFKEDFEREAKKILRFNKINGISSKKELNENIWADLGFGIGGSLPWVGAPIAAAGTGYYISAWMDSDGFEAAMNLIMAVLSALQVIGSLAAVGGIPLGIAKTVLLPIKGLGAALNAGSKLTKTQKITAAALKPGGALAVPAKTLVRSLRSMRGSVDDIFVKVGTDGTTKASRKIATTLGTSSDDALRISKELGAGFSGSVRSLDDVIKVATGARTTAATMPAVGRLGTATAARAAAGIERFLAGPGGRVFGSSSSTVPLRVMKATPTGGAALGRFWDDAVGLGVAAPGTPHAGKIMFKSPGLAAEKGKAADYVFHARVEAIDGFEALMSRSRAIEPRVADFVTMGSKAATGEGFSATMKSPISRMMRWGAVGTGATGLGVATVDAVSGFTDDALEATGFGGDEEIEGYEDFYEEVFGNVEPGDDVSGGSGAAPASVGDGTMIRNDIVVR